jgi:DNA-binding transcriptional LysR family regulator
MVARDTFSDLPGFRFALDEVDIIMPSHHKAAGLATVHPSQFSNEDFVLFPRSGNPGYHDRLLKWAREAGLEFNVVHEIESWVGAAALVGAGLGVSFGTTLLSRATIPGVVSRNFSVPAFDVSFWVTWFPDRPNPAAEKLIELMRATR